MSIMTEIRDRLMASGDTEAAHALDHACFAARDRLDALDEMRKDVAAKDARIAELEARLEIDHAYQWQGDSEELVRIDIAPEDRATFPDGITARDATIKLQDEALERKRERIAELEETVAKAFLRVTVLEEALKEAGIYAETPQEPQDGQRAEKPYPTTQES